MPLFKKGQVIFWWARAHPPHPTLKPLQPLKELHPFYTKLFCHLVYNYHQ